MDYNVKQKNSTKKLIHDVDKQTVALDTKMQRNVQLENANKTGRNAFSDAKPDDLVVGSLNLVSITFIC